MIQNILRDTARYPYLFEWNGEIPKNELGDWLVCNAIKPGDDLKELWERTGGGTIFETETILGPVGDATHAEDVASVNRYHWQQGMNTDLLVFHSGLGGLTAIDQRSGHVVQLHADEYRIEREFNSLDEWYAGVLRAEYADRYGLDGW